MTDLFRQSDFQQHDRLLWSVLARLARAGYVTSPDEGAELMQAFYAEAWPKLLLAYDRRKASFQTYLARAFYLFSRRHIVREANWRGRLADMAMVVDATPKPEETLEHREEIESVRDALGNLPEKDRSIIMAFLSSRTRERDLARRYGMTRHELRETLVDALGLLATRLGAFSQASVDGQIARMLWYEGRTVRDTAQLVKLTTAEVQTRRSSLSASILKAVRQLNTFSFRESDMNSDLRLLKDVLLSSVHDEEALSRLEKEADRMRLALHEDELELSMEEKDRLDPVWAARVLETLAGKDETTERERSISEAIAALHEEEDEEIGRAFGESLLPTLPKEYGEWDRWFHAVPRVADSYRAILCEFKVVRSAGAHADGLATYGMTPATFFEASHGIQLLADRLLLMASGPSNDVEAMSELEPLLESIRTRRAEGVPVNLEINLQREKKITPDPAGIPYGLLISQIRATPDCPKEAAAPLLRWMVSVAQLKPFFIPGYQSQTLDTDRISLTPDVTSREQEELAYRWGRCVQEVEELVPA